jgi:hypothetical protein
MMTSLAYLFIHQCFIFRCRSAADLLLDASNGCHAVEMGEFLLKLVCETSPVNLPANDATMMVDL